MDRYTDTVQNEIGNAVAGASVLILDAAGQTAAIFANRTGTQPLANPVVTDKFGSFTFCAADGLYSARVSIAGVVKATLPEIRLEDPSNGLAVYAGTGGAALIGTTGGSNVQAELDALAEDVAVLPTDGGAAAIGTAQGITVQEKLDALQEQTDGHYNYTLPAATANALGGVKVGARLSVTPQGELSADAYVLPKATGAALGGVIIGSGLSVDANGVLSNPGVAVGTVGKVNDIAPGTDGNVVLNTDNLPESGSPTNQWFTAARVRSAALTGLTTVAAAAIAATDTVMGALAKLQAQLGTKQDKSEKDANNGYAGLDGHALRFKNASGNNPSTLHHANTAARSYGFPDKDGTVALLADRLLSKVFVSADQTITQLGVLTIAHGLGETPKVILPFARVTVSAAPYSAGQIIAANPGGGHGGGGTGLRYLCADATNIYMQFDNGGTLFSIVNENAKFFIRVYA